MDEDSKGIMVAAAVLAALAAAGFGAYRLRLTAPAVPSPFSEPAPVPAPPPAQAPPPAAAPVPLPPLEDTDEFVREKARALSSNRLIARWLTLDDLAARLAAGFHRVSEGQVPRESLAAFAPKGRFRARLTDGRLVADPRSHARYDPVAAAARSIDAAAAAKVLEELMPLIQDAYRGIGPRDADARAALLRAIDELLKAPEARGAALVERKKGIVYAYADERLERLSPAQKQLMRMGPGNAAVVQAKLRELKAALSP